MDGDNNTSTAIGSISTFRAAGFTSAQASFAATMLLHAEFAASADDEPDSAADWIATYLPPEWICRLLANHVTSSAVGVEIFERSILSGNLSMVFRLDIRADALGANCRDLIVEPHALRSRLFHANSAKAATPRPPEDRTR